MLRGLFRSCTQEESPSAVMQLRQTLKMLKEKENVLQGKISTEIEREERFNKSKNKDAAGQCLKRRKFYEEKLQHVANIQSRIRDQLQEAERRHFEQIQQKMSRKGYFTK